MSKCVIKLAVALFGVGIAASSPGLAQTAPPASQDKERIKQFEFIFSPSSTIHTLIGISENQDAAFYFLSSRSEKTVINENILGENVGKSAEVTTDKSYTQKQSAREDAILLSRSGESGFLVQRPYFDSQSWQMVSLPIEIVTGTWQDLMRGGQITFKLTREGEEIRATYQMKDISRVFMRMLIADGEQVSTSSTPDRALFPWKSAPGENSVEFDRDRSECVARLSEIECTWAEQHLDIYFKINP